MQWQFAGPSPLRDGEEASFLIGTYSRAPNFGAAILYPDQVSFVED